MNIVAIEKPSLFWRVAQFPLTRLVVLGGIVFFLMAQNNYYMEKFASSQMLRLAITVAMAALGLAIYIGFVHFVERRPVSELSLRGMGLELGTGLLVGASLYTACVLILMLLGIYRIDGMHPWHFMLPAIALALSSGIFEELLFRGVLFRIVEEVFGSWISLVVSSFVFGFMHLINPAATIEGAIFISIEAGLLLAAAYMVTRRLWMAMGFHMSWNYTQSGIFSGIVSGGVSEPGLIKPTIEGPDLLTGGSFGLESSLIAFLLCTTTGVILLLLAMRRGHVVPVFWCRKS